MRMTYPHHPHLVVRLLRAIFLSSKLDPFQLSKTLAGIYLCLVEDSQTDSHQHILREE